jgi:hypothetical protein
LDADVNKIEKFYHQGKRKSFRTRRFNDTSTGQLLVEKDETEVMGW